MSTRAQQTQLLANQTFGQQVQGALIAAAVNIVNESASTANHANRLQWANAIILDPYGQTQRFLPAMLTNPTVAAEAGNPNGPSGTPVSDSDCDYVVASLFDAFASQYAAATHNVVAPLLLGAQV